MDVRQFVQATSRNYLNSRYYGQGKSLASLLENTLDKKQEVIEELEALVIEGSWRELLPYFNSGKLLICQEETNMVEIGSMMVLDNDDKLSKLAEIGAIAPPLNESIIEWNDNPEEKIFKFIEIIPYCLAQVTSKGKKRGPL